MTMKELPKIYTVLPDEVRNMHPHGQWCLDLPGALINFNCDNTDHVPGVDVWADKLERFRADPTQELLEFESPHMPGRYFLHREALAHIILTQPAWSAKVMARPTENGKVQLLDAGTGMPVLRRKLN